jgi:hypothetical protein
MFFIPIIIVYPFILFPFYCQYPTFCIIKYLIDDFSKKISDFWDKTDNYNFYKFLTHLYFSGILVVFGGRGLVHIRAREFRSNLEVVSKMVVFGTVIVPVYKAWKARLSYYLINLLLSASK